MSSAQIIDTGAALNSGGALLLSIYNATGATVAPQDVVAGYLIGVACLFCFRRRKHDRPRMETGRAMVSSAFAVVFGLILDNWARTSFPAIASVPDLALVALAAMFGPPVIYAAINIGDIISAPATAERLIDRVVGKKRGERDE